MFEFFDELAPENSEQISETRADKIKASVLSRIKEEKPMKKLFRIKPLVIAAAIMTTGAICAVSAGAAVNTNISELTLPNAGVAQTNTTEPSDEIEQSVGTDPWEDPEAENEPSAGEVNNAETDSGSKLFGDPEFTRAVFDFLNEYHESHKDDRNNDSPYEMFMGFNYLTSEVFYNTSSFDFAMLYEDSDGIRHYKTSDGKKVSVTPTAIGGEVRIYFLDDAVPEGDLSAITAAP